MNLNDKQSIYEIYRACRLCGGGAGYKMPIIQSLIDIGGEDTDLKKKISECVQLEVSLTDRMPPLICELCVDKVNDYYEFRQMCHNTNKSIRQRLGLPVQTLTELAMQVEKDKSVLNITEPVYLFSDSDEETPLSKNPVKIKSRPKSAIKRDDVRLKVDKPSVPSPSLEVERRESNRKRESSPKRASRQNTDEVSLTQLQGVQVSHKPSGPKSALRKRELQRATEPKPDCESEDESLLVPRSKKSRETPVENAPPAKKPKLPEPSKPERTQKAGPKSSKATPTPPQPSSKAGPKSRKVELPAKSQEILPSAKRRNEVAMLKSNPMPPSRAKRVEDTPVKKRDSTVPASKGKKPEISQIPSKGRRSEVVTPQPTSKSRREVSPVSISKSQKTEVPSNALRSKRRDPSPKSKKPEPSAQRPGAAPHQKTVCEICGLRFKTLTAKLSHLRKHAAANANSSKVTKPPPTPEPPSASPPQKVVKCIVCKMKVRSKNYSAHLKTHTPSFTPLRQACNPCELWFTTSEEAVYHHRRHTNGLPYTCTKCYDDFRNTQDFDLHIVRKQCLPTYETPDVKCDECWQMFPTYTLLEQHRCSGQNARPGGKCSNCSRSYSLMKHLVAHEMKCTAKKKEEPPAQPDLLKDMLPMKVRIVKCDLLLKTNDDDAYDVSGLSHRFGLDRNSSYPYLYSVGEPVKIRTESNSDHMVSISDDIKEEYLNENDPTSQKQFKHWDSEDSAGALSDASNKTADSLSTISLKTIFSKKYFGEVPKTQRKDLDKAYDSTLSIDFGNISKDVDTIIGKLSDETQSDKYDSDSILDKNKAVNVDSSDTDADHVYSTPAEDKESDKTSPKDNTNNVGDEKDEQIKREMISIDEEMKSESETLQTTENEADKVETEENIGEQIDESEDKSENATESNTQKNVEEASNNIKEVEPTNDSKDIKLNAVQSEESNTGNAAIHESESTVQKNVKDEIENGAAIKDKDIAFNDVQNEESNVVNTDDSQSSEVINYNDVHSIDKDSQDSLNNTSNITDTVSQNGSQSTSNLTNNDDLVYKNEPHVASINNDNTESSTSFKDSIFKSIEALANIDKFNINDLNEADKLLMNEIDEQIGENVPSLNDTDTKETNSVNNSENRLKDDINKSEIQLNSGKDVDLINNDNDSIFNTLNNEIDSKIEENERKQTDLRSLDLDNVSDEEFNFDI